MLHLPPLAAASDVPAGRPLHDQTLDAHRRRQYVEPLPGFGEVRGDRCQLQRGREAGGELLQAAAADVPPLGAQVDPGHREQVERDVRRRYGGDQLPCVGCDHAALQGVEGQPGVDQHQQLAVQYDAVVDLANGGRGDVGESIGQVFALP